MLAAKPAGAFSASAPLLLTPYPAPVVWLGYAIGIGAAASTVQHAVYLHPRYRR